MFFEMEKFNTKINKIYRFIAEAARLIEEEGNVKEFFYERYGSEVEYDARACLLNYLWEEVLVNIEGYCPKCRAVINHKTDMIDTGTDGEYEYNYIKCPECSTEFKEVYKAKYDYINSIIED